MTSRIYVDTIFFLFFFDNNHFLPSRIYHRCCFIFFLHLFTAPCSSRDLSPVPLFHRPFPPPLQSPFSSPFFLHHRSFNILEKLQLPTVIDPQLFLHDQTHECRPDLHFPLSFNLILDLSRK